MKTKAQIDPEWTRTDPLEFVVYGESEQKGSASAFVIKGKNGAPPRAIVTSSNKRLKGWEHTVRTEAQRHASGRIFVDPIELRCAFVMRRPLSVRGVNVWCPKRPDLDKLARAIGDALTGVAYTDDAIIVQMLTRKRYANEGEAPHVTLRVSLMSDLEVEPKMF